MDAMFVGGQFVAHALGDYWLQSDWMATQKVKSLRVACIHGLAYSVPFLFLLPSLLAWTVIVVSHAIIDRFRVAKYIAFVKNFLAPREYWPKWEDCKETGYHKERPPHLTMWLLIFTDNILHVLCNAAALRWL